MGVHTPFTRLSPLGQLVTQRPCGPRAAPVGHGVCAVPGVASLGTVFGEPGGICTFGVSPRVHLPSTSLSPGGHRHLPSTSISPGGHVGGGGVHTPFTRLSPGGHVLDGASGAHTPFTRPSPLGQLVTQRPFGPRAKPVAHGVCAVPGVALFGTVLGEPGGIRTFGVGAGLHLPSTSTSPVGHGTHLPSTVTLPAGHVHMPASLRTSPGAQRC
jgi:hypothetical protein